MLVVDVMVPFYPCFNFNFFFVFGYGNYDNEFETKENGNTPGGQELLRGATPYVNGLYGEVPPESGTVGTLKSYLFKDGYTKGVLLLSRMVQYKGKGRGEGGGVRDWTSRRSFPL